MSQDVAPPPPGRIKSKERRRLAPWLSDKPDTRSVQIGVLGTVLIHLLLLLFAPWLFRTSRSPSAAHRPAGPHRFNIQLVPRQPGPPPPRNRMKYVEANPNAPENVPDKTDNVSDRNQQVAQEKPVAKSKSDMPSQEGRKDIQQQQVVTGTLEKPQENVPVPPTPPKAAMAQTPRREQNPLAGLDKSQGNSPDGFATNIGKISDNQQLIPQRIDGVKDGPQYSNFSSGLPQIDPKHPQARRKVEIHTRPAVFAENKFGTSNMGVTALDSRWSNYGVYMKRLTEAVQIQWDKILDESQIYQTPGNSVSVTFILNSKGGITTILKTENTDGTSDAAKQACIAGITLPAPYGPWTDDMIATFGTQTQLTFTFFYQ